jgi:hypothetical protein
MQTLIAVLVFLIIIFVYKKIRKKKNALWLFFIGCKQHTP